MVSAYFLCVFLTVNIGIISADTFANETSALDIVIKPVTALFDNLLLTEREAALMKFDDVLEGMAAFADKSDSSILGSVLNMLIQQGLQLVTYLKNAAKRLFDAFITNPGATAVPLNDWASLVDVMLRTNEYSHEFPPGGSVKSYDSNQLASNNPMEDARSEGSCLQTPGLLMGVFDGHAGTACAQVVSKRLYQYIALCLLPHDQLQRCLAPSYSLIQSYNDKLQFVEDIRDVYANSFKEFILDLSKDVNRDINIKSAFGTAFLRLDSDLSKEALPKPPEAVNLKTLSVAMSGAVSCVAHIDGPHLNIANLGDCNAVLGVLDDSSWIADKLTTEHNSYNQAEVMRIMSEHPRNESSTIIKMERLLGQLAPLRAFGDFRYKWSKQILRNVALQHFGESTIPPNYYTPPYLTAKPDVIYRRLTPDDKFLVLASDGLWDIISPLQVVRYIGEHMRGKVTLSPLKLPRKNMTLGEIHETLLQRKEGLKMKPKDRNAATHLIRNALGGSEYGIDHGKLSQMLSLPEDVSRVFRDDITVTVIYFDSEYLRHCPQSHL